MTDSSSLFDSEDPVVQDIASSIAVYDLISAPTVDDLKTLLESISSAISSGDITSENITSVISAMLNLLYDNGLTQTDEYYFYQEIYNSTDSETTIEALQELMFAYVLDSLSSSEGTSNLISSTTQPLNRFFSSLFEYAIMSLVADSDYGLLDYLEEFFSLFPTPVSYENTNSDLGYSQDSLIEFLSSFTSYLSGLTDDSGDSLVDSSLIDDFKKKFLLTLSLIQDINFNEFLTSIYSLDHAGVIRNYFDFAQKVKYGTYSGSLSQAITSAIVANSLSTGDITGAGYLQGIEDLLADDRWTDTQKSDLESYYQGMFKLFHGKDSSGTEPGTTSAAYGSTLTLSLPAASSYTTTVTDTFGIWEIGISEIEATAFIGLIEPPYHYYQSLVINEEYDVAYIWNNYYDIMDTYSSATDLFTDYFSSNSTNSTISFSALSDFADALASNLIDFGVSSDDVSEFQSTYSDGLQNLYSSYINDLLSYTVSSEAAVIFQMINSMLPPLFVNNADLALAQFSLMSLFSSSNLSQNGINGFSFLQIGIEFLNYISAYVDQSVLDMIGSFMMSLLPVFENYGSQETGSETETTSSIPAQLSTMTQLSIVLGIAGIVIGLGIGTLLAVAADVLMGVLGVAEVAVDAVVETTNITVFTAEATSLVVAADSAGVEVSAVASGIQAATTALEEAGLAGVTAASEVGSAAADVVATAAGEVAENLGIDSLTLIEAVQASITGAVDAGVDTAEFSLAATAVINDAVSSVVSSAAISEGLSQAVVAAGLEVSTIVSEEGFVAAVEAVAEAAGVDSESLLNAVTNAAVDAIDAGVETSSFTSATLPIIESSAGITSSITQEAISSAATAAGLSSQVVSAGVQAVVSSSGAAALSGSLDASATTVVESVAELIGVDSDALIDAVNTVGISIVDEVGDEFSTFSLSYVVENATSVASEEVVTAALDSANELASAFSDLSTAVADAVQPAVDAIIQAAKSLASKIAGITFTEVITSSAEVSDIVSSAAESIESITSALLRASDEGSALVVDSLEQLKSVSDALSILNTMFDNASEAIPEAVVEVVEESTEALDEAVSEFVDSVIASVDTSATGSIQLAALAADVSSETLSSGIQAAFNATEGDLTSILSEEAEAAVTAIAEDEGIDADNLIVAVEQAISKVSDPGELFLAAQEILESGVESLVSSFQTSVSDLLGDALNNALTTDAIESSLSTISTSMESTSDAISNLSSISTDFVEALTSNLDIIYNQLVNIGSAIEDDVAEEVTGAVEQLSKLKAVAYEKLVSTFTTSVLEESDIDADVVIEGIRTYLSSTDKEDLSALIGEIADEAGASEDELIVIIDSLQEVLGSSQLELSSVISASISLLEDAAGITLDGISSLFEAASTDSISALDIQAAVQEVIDTSEISGLLSGLDDEAIIAVQDAADSLGVDEEALVEAINTVGSTLSETVGENSSDFALEVLIEEATEDGVESLEDVIAEVPEDAPEPEITAASLSQDVSAFRGAALDVSISLQGGDTAALQEAIDAMIVEAQNTTASFENISADTISESFENVCSSADRVAGGFKGMALNLLEAQNAEADITGALTQMRSLVNSVEDLAAFTLLSNDIADFSTNFSSLSSFIEAGDTSSIATLVNKVSMQMTALIEDVSNLTVDVIAYSPQSVSELVEALSETSTDLFDSLETASTLGADGAEDVSSQIGSLSESIASLSFKVSEATVINASVAVDDVSSVVADLATAISLDDVAAVEEGVDSLSSSIRSLLASSTSITSDVILSSPGSVFQMAGSLKDIALSVTDVLIDASVAGAQNTGGVLLDFSGIQTLANTWLENSAQVLQAFADATGETGFDSSVEESIDLVSDTDTAIRATWNGISIDTDLGDGIDTSELADVIEGIEGADDDEPEIDLDLVDISEDTTVDTKSVLNTLTGVSTTYQTSVNSTLNQLFAVSDTLQIGVDFSASDIMTANLNSMNTEIESVISTLQNWVDQLDDIEAVNGSVGDFLSESADQIEVYIDQIQDATRYLDILSPGSSDSIWESFQSNIEGLETLQTDLSIEESAANISTTMIEVSEDAEEMIAGFIDDASDLSSSAQDLASTTENVYLQDAADNLSGALSSMVTNTSESLLEAQDQIETAILNVLSATLDDSVSTEAQQMVVYIRAAYTNLAALSEDMPSEISYWYGVVLKEVNVPSLETLQNIAEGALFITQASSNESLVATSDSVAAIVEDLWTFTDESLLDADSQLKIAVESAATAFDDSDTVEAAKFFTKLLEELYKFLPEPSDELSESMNSLLRLYSGPQITVDESFAFDEAVDTLEVSLTDAVDTYGDTLQILENLVEAGNLSASVVDSSIESVTLKLNNAYTLLLSVDWEEVEFEKGFIEVLIESISNHYENILSIEFSFYDTGVEESTTAALDELKEAASKLNILAGINSEGVDATAATITIDLDLVEPVVDDIVGVVLRGGFEDIASDVAAIAESSSNNDVFRAATTIIDILSDISDGSTSSLEGAATLFKSAVSDLAENIIDEFAYDDARQLTVYLRTLYYDLSVIPDLISSDVTTSFTALLESANIVSIDSLSKIFTDATEIGILSSNQMVQSAVRNITYLIQNLEVFAVDEISDAQLLFQSAIDNTARAIYTGAEESETKLLMDVLSEVNDALSTSGYLTDDLTTLFTSLSLLADDGPVGFAQDMITSYQTSIDQFVSDLVDSTDEELELGIGAINGAGDLALESVESLPASAFHESLDDIKAILVSLAEANSSLQDVLSLESLEGSDIASSFSTLVENSSSQVIDLTNDINEFQTMLALTQIQNKLAGDIVSDITLIQAETSSTSLQTASTSLVQAATNISSASFDAETAQGYLLEAIDGTIDALSEDTDAARGLLSSIVKTAEALAPSLDDPQALYSAFNGLIDAMETADDVTASVETINTEIISSSSAEADATEIAQMIAEGTNTVEGIGVDSLVKDSDSFIYSIQVTTNSIKQATNSENIINAADELKNAVSAVSTGDTSAAYDSLKSALTAASAGTTEDIQGAADLRVLIKTVMDANNATFFASTPTPSADLLESPIAVIDLYSDLFNETSSDAVTSVYDVPVSDSEETAVDLELVDDDSFEEDDDEYETSEDDEEDDDAFDYSIDTQTPMEDIWGFDQLVEEEEIEGITAPVDSIVRESVQAYADALSQFKELVDADLFSTDQYLFSLQSLNDAGSDALLTLATNADDLSETFAMQMYFILGQIDDSVTAVSNKVVIEIADDIEEGATIGADEGSTYTNDYIDEIRKCIALRNTAYIVSSILGAGAVSAAGVIIDQVIEEGDDSSTSDDDESNGNG